MSHKKSAYSQPRSNLALMGLAIASLSTLLAGCGGGAAGGQNQITNTITPSGTISAAGGSTLSFTASANAQQGPISGSTWSIVQVSGDPKLLVPVMTNSDCAKANTSYLQSVPFSARLTCSAGVKLPALTANASWVLSSTSASPSGTKTDTVTINGTPTPANSAGGIQIINTDTQKQVSAGDTVNVSCTASGGQYGITASPKIVWTYGTLSLNGQPYAINPAETQVTNPDGSVTDTLAVIAPKSLYTPTSMGFTCAASDDISTVTKVFTVNFTAAPSVPFNVIGGQVISGTAGSPVSLDVTVQDPTNTVTSQNVYTRWSQISGTPVVIPAGTFKYGHPFNFTAPANATTAAQTLVFQVDASATPLTDTSAVPSSQSTQITYLNFPNINGGVDVSAGSPQTVTMGGTATLSGTATASNGSVITGQTWAVTSAPSGSSASVVNSTSLTAQFTPDVAGTYVMTLTVTGIDGTGASITRTAQTTVTAN